MSPKNYNSKSTHPTATPSHKKNTMSRPFHYIELVDNKKDRFAKLDFVTTKKVLPSVAVLRQERAESRVDFGQCVSSISQIYDDLDRKLRAYTRLEVSSSELCFDVHMDPAMFDILNELVKQLNRDNPDWIARIFKPASEAFILMRLQPRSDEENTYVSDVSDSDIEEEQEYEEDEEEDDYSEEDSDEDGSEPVSTSTLTQKESPNKKRKVDQDNSSVSVAASS